MVTAASNSLVQCVFFATLKVTLEYCEYRLLFLVTRTRMLVYFLFFFWFFVTSKSSATVSL